MNTWGAYFEKISLAKMNSVGTYFLIGTGKIRLRESHSFGMFLIKKKSANLLQQIYGPHSTCEEVVVGTVQGYFCPKNSNATFLPYYMAIAQFPLPVSF